MPRLAGLLVLAFSPLALGQEVLLDDGRRYAGESRRHGKRLRIRGPKRIIDVPGAQAVDAPADPTGDDSAELWNAWRARLGRLASAAALAQADALAAQAQAERRVLAAAACAPLAELFPEGPPEGLPDQTEAIAGELARVRIARRYGRWLSGEELRALEPTRVARAETFLAALEAARSEPERLDALFSEDLPRLDLPYSVWEALVRGGAGASWERPSPEAVRGLQRVALAEGGQAEYLLRVPEDFEPERGAPLIVGLHGQDEPLTGMLGCWGAFAEAAGMLLASVEYAIAQPGYRHSYREHRTVLATIDALARRFHVDPDRVFVTGHSMGGHAAWDLAFSHPDRFAGVVPLISSHFAFDHHYRRNARQVPVYCIQGEHDVWTERCRAHTRTLIDWGCDTTYVEYLDRGHEGFYEELPWVRPWMAARRRDPYPRRFELRAGRPTDLRRFWVRLDRLAIPFFDEAPTSKVAARFVATVEAKVEGKNTIRVECKAAQALTVFLSDRLVDLDRPLRLRVNRKVRFKGRVERSAEHMLRDFLARGDRQMLFAASVELEGLR